MAILAHKYKKKGYKVYSNFDLMGLSEIIGDDYYNKKYEHNSVLRPLEHLKKIGVEVDILWCDLKDFDDEFATLFSGVRHDSGDPIEWGEKFIKAYEELGINPKTKTLLFSDGLDFKTADKIYKYFNPRINVAFGIIT